MPPSAPLVGFMSGEGGEGAGPVPMHVLESWRSVYQGTVQEAVALGIPESAIPALEEPLRAEDLRAKKALLDQMIQSFLSSAL